MYNRRVKFGLKISDRLGKMSENLRGGGLTHTVFLMFVKLPSFPVLPLGSLAASKVKFVYCCSMTFYRHGCASSHTADIIRAVKGRNLGGCIIGQLRSVDAICDDNNTVYCNSNKFAYIFQHRCKKTFFLCFLLKF